MHRAVARVSITAIALALVFVVSQQGVSRAGPQPVVAAPRSILPDNVGIGISTDASVTIPFDHAVDRASVEQGLSVIPDAAVGFSWSPDGRSVEVTPRHRWVTDQRYVLILPAAVHYQDGVTTSATRRMSFTTETAPVVSDFQLQYVPQDPARLTTSRSDGLTPFGPRTNGAVAATIEQRIRGMLPLEAPPDTASEVSAHTEVSIAFTSAMDSADVEAHFAINPQVAGDLNWRARTLVFSPSQPLKPGARYAISLAGSHDITGNPLGGDSSFSFTTIRAGQPVKVLPGAGSTNITKGDVELWFSQPMATGRTADAFSLTDLTGGRKVAGALNWNAAGTHLHFRSRRSLAKGHRFRIELSAGAVDSDGNSVKLSSTFRTKAAPAPAPRPATARVAPATRSAAPPPAAAATMTGYARNQVNAARAAYGFAGVALDGAVSSVANVHAWDMLRNGYFSHTGLDGSTVRTRLARAGVSYAYAGENICYRAGLSIQAALNWCHAQFMAEPYPGFYNHIGNILDPHYRRLGVGIAASGGRVYVVWDYAG